MALVCNDGSIDWLGLPRFDSPACFAALLGDPKHGRWLIAPRAKSATVTRQYRDSTMILETVFKTRTGRVRVSDFMTGSLHNAGIIRIVTGLEGKVVMRTEMVVRFDYGSIVPWVRRLDDGRLQMTAGPDRLLLDTDVELRGENMKTVGEFEIHVGKKKAFVLTWTPSFHDLPDRTDPYKSHKRIEKVWSYWGKDLQAQKYVWPGGAAFIADAEGTDSLGDRRDRLPPRRRPCRNSSAASATGTTAIVGCAMPPSRSMR